MVESQPQGSTCLICFCEYTAAGLHRIVSLKCGHIFGQDCIEKWLKISKNSHCPSCFAPIKKIHLRPIFATEISCTDNAKELKLIEKYHQEKEKLLRAEQKISELKSEIEILKLTVANITKKRICSVEEHSVPTVFLNEIKLHFYPEYSILEYDPVNCTVLVTCQMPSKKESDIDCPSRMHGIYKYLITDQDVNSFIKFNHKISYLKMSPFNDGLCIVCAGHSVSILNVLNENILFYREFVTIITCAIFNEKNRDVIFVGDLKGTFHRIYLTTDAIELNSSIKLFDLPIQNIVQADYDLYVSSLFSVKMMRIPSDEIVENSSESAHSDVKWSEINDLSFKDLEICKKGVFIFMDAWKNTVLLSIRDSNSSIYFHVTGNREVQTCSGITQFRKVPNRIYGEYIYSIDNLKKSLKVLNLANFNNIFSYDLEFDLIDFAIKKNYMVILTQKRIRIYKV